MKNIKDITLSIFAIIGFISIITAFNTQPQQETHGTPESHVWEMYASNSGMTHMYMFNKQTGEVKYFENRNEFSLKFKN